MQSAVERRVRSGVLLCPAAVSFSGFVLLALIAGRQQFFDLDRDTRAAVQLAREPLLDAAMRGITTLGDNTGLIPLIVLASALVWRTSRRWALVIPAVMAGTGVLQHVAKWAVDRPRPNLHAWGFPSGHVLSLVVFFGLVAYLLCGSGAGRRWRCVGSAGCAVAVLTVAFSRLYLEAHWLSDVAGGFMLGLSYLLLIIWVAEASAGAPRPGARTMAPPDLAGPAVAAS